MTAPEEFIEQLMKDHHKNLYKYCRRITHYNPAYAHLIDDCIQHVFTKAYLDYDRLVQSGNTVGWLYKCCGNYLRSLYRRNRRRDEIVHATVRVDQCTDLVDPTDDIIRWLEREAAKDVLATLKGTLSPLEQLVFHDYYELDLSMKEAAERNDLSVASVRAAVERIRTKLKGMTFLIFIFLLGCISLVSRTI